MQRKNLALIATGLCLFAALFLQMTAVQAAVPRQTTPDTATNEPQPLPQPIRIQIRQLIPITISVPASLLATSAPVTGSLATTATEPGEAAITTTAGLTESAPVAATETATATAEAASDETASTEAAAGDTPTQTTEITVPVVMSSMPVTLEVLLDLVVTNTLTTTVPASVTLQFADLTTTTLPISVTVGVAPDSEVVIELLPSAETPTAEPTATSAITETADITPTATVTATETTTVTTPGSNSGLPAINTTATVTANLRSGPATTFDLVGQTGPGEPLALVAISEDGQWYLLDTGVWIASFLVADQPTTLPIATQEIIDQVQGRSPAVTPAPTITETAVVTATAVATATEQATPVPATTTATPPTATVDANFRTGPGTEFPVIGGTVTGQVLTLVGRNADGTWFRLDNTGWIFGDLVANLPPIDTIPVVNADGTPVAGSAEPAATPTPLAGGGGLFPTPTPLAPAAATTTTVSAETPAITPTVETTTTVATGPNATYVAAAQRVVSQYDTILQTLDALIAQASSNSAILADATWGTRVNAAIALLRQASATVGELQPPAGLEPIQQDLLAAAQQYTTAANALAQAATTGAVAQLDSASAALELANTSLTNAETALAKASQ